MSRIKDFIAAVLGSLLAAGTPAFAQQANPSPALITGYPAQVRLSRGPFILHRKAPCVLVRVASTRPARLFVATRGLRSSRLALVTGDGCPAGNARWSERLVADFPLPFRFRTIALDIDSELAGTAEAVEGELLVVDGSGRQSAATITIAAPRPSVLGTAFGWFFGLLVPTLITAAVAYGVARWTQLEEEREAFDAFRELERLGIDAAAEELRIVLRAEHAERPGQMAYEILNKYKILTALPRAARRKLTNYCRANRMSAIVKFLEEQFPGISETLLGED